MPVRRQPLVLMQVDVEASVSVDDPGLIVGFAFDANHGGAWNAA